MNRTIDLHHKLHGPRNSNSDKNNTQLLWCNRWRLRVSNGQTVLGIMRGWYVLLDPQKRGIILIPYFPLISFARHFRRTDRLWTTWYSILLSYWIVNGLRKGIERHMGEIIGLPTFDAGWVSPIGDVWARVRQDARSDGRSTGGRRWSCKADSALPQTQFRRTV